MSNMKLLEINNLNKSFDNKEILKDINLSIQSGKIIGLLGKNGVGKTTLLQEFTKDYKDVISFDCSIVSDREQLFLWGQKMTSVLGELPEYPDFSDIFTALNNKNDSDEKRILIFDEFQNIAKVSEE